MNTNLLSLVSQVKNSIHIEIIEDDLLTNKELHETKNQNKK